jgi:hypothetical protein
MTREADLVLPRGTPGGVRGRAVGGPGSVRSHASTLPLSGHLPDLTGPAIDRARHHRPSVDIQAYTRTLEEHRRLP